MARKSVVGQLNMFDLYDAPLGDVEMVSLMPSLEEPQLVAEPEIIEEPELVAEPEIIEEPELVAEPQTIAEAVEESEIIEEAPVISKSLGDNDAVVMSRSYEKAGEKIEIAYMNYNKVRIQIGNEVPEIKVFASSKEAVDFYVQKMQALEDDE